MNDGILGIENRTENWKTARIFAPLSKCQRARFVASLCPRTEVSATSVKMELFWKGVCDHVHESDTDKEFWSEYSDMFRGLRNCIKSSTFRLQLPNKWNYATDCCHKSKLLSNLKGTEIDIVFETPDHLFIGEAKSLSGFGRDGKLVLVHQLIRQYVAASLLMRVKKEKKKIIPFIVADNLDSVNRSEQVKFMKARGWLDKANIIDWDDVLNRVAGRKMHRCAQAAAS
ncbi:MAG: hypothetical protein OXF31_08935 [Gammaproteobacteria bacterium]|nr:hypothetical protein [Gammaproteobacteria bacterium]